ncbi:hypothetical protein ACFS07_13135 [Undibacterium arcticum]
MYHCWLNAKRNKSKRLRVQQFGEDPLRYLTIIQERLQSRSYSFGPYKSFTVREKKFRHVVDAPMKDRVVHWMLYDYMLPIWQPRFIHDTYGNLPGRGTHAAVRRLAEFLPSSVQQVGAATRHFQVFLFGQPRHPEIAGVALHRR